MTDYTQLPPPQAAQVISSWISAWDAEEPTRWANLGLRCLAVESQGLWKLVTDPGDGLPCRSFRRWLQVVAPRKTSTCYQALEDAKALSDIPAADFAQMPQSAMGTMKMLSTSVRRDPDVLEAAQRGGKALVEMVQRKHPEQHLDSKTWWKAQLTVEVRQKLEALLDRVGEGSTDERLDVILDAALCGWDVNSGEGVPDGVTIH